MITAPRRTPRARSAVRALASWPSTRRGRAYALVLAMLLMNVLLLAPQWAAPGTVPFRWIAAEAVLLVLIFAALPRRPWSLALAGAVAMAVAFAALTAVGDATMRLSLSRPLNLYLDLRLLGAVLNLLTGTLGPVVTWLAVAAAALALIGTVALLGHLLAPPRGVRPLARGRVGAPVALVLGALTIGAANAGEVARYVDFPAVRLGLDQGRFIRLLQEERETFMADLRSTPGSYADLPGLLNRLGGRDVVLAFVESYGVVAVDDPRYSPVIRPRLEDMEARLEAAGLHLATGTLVAPSQGGQSWLGHGTVLSGLWLGNQMRYDLLLASDRPTLIDDFEAAGYRTAALMPAITLAWPEGDRFGYEEIYAFHEIDYAGPPLNWVTMPDQFTWSFLERTIRRGSNEPGPVFAELGLISSHAPWTPILPVLEDWDTIGDGSVFAPFAGAGERPEDLWRDVERVREHFALSIDYALHAATAYAERYVGEDALLIVLGDHQPAPLITGEGAPRTVPVHVISGAPELIEPFVKWGFERGAFAPADPDPPGMDRFRDWFVRTFSK